MNRLFAVLLALTIFITALDRVFVLDPVRITAQSLTTPISYELYRSGQEVSYWVQFTASLPRIYKHNQDLTLENAQLYEKLVEFDNLRQENSALREQLGVAGVRTEEKILASVVGLVDEGKSTYLILDKGDADDVIEGSTVVVGMQLIGKVARVTGRHAYVLPTVGVESRIPVRVIQEEGEVVKGIARGQYNQQVVLEEVLQEQPLRNGGIVVTSGEGGAYPADLVIGEVINEHSNETEVFKGADIKMFWQLSDLRDVFILKG